ncbi:MAG: recombinase family protein [Parasporobacterium sp.]|nr:recombinase family protein [Parasporobacterium sp.]
MWQERHDEIEAKREAIRRRIRNTRDVSSELRAAKPKPTISDDSEKRVAVYTRVSTMSTDQTSSIENQSIYYEKKIDDMPNWELQEIYSDEGKSGTSLRHRDAFKRMIADAAEKRMDIILCASVSRFARNMSDCMTFIRQLKTMNPSHPIGVYFETENIYTLDPDSTQSLSIHAMLADWESANKSRRMILSYDQRICTGQYPVADLLGYRHTKDGDLVIEPEEAKTVRYIFLSYIIGKSFKEIADDLTEMERETLHGRTDWNEGMTRAIVQNERRWGDLEARKTIVIDYVEHKSKRNEEDRISAYAYGHHEAIVSPEIAAATKIKIDSGCSFRGKIPTQKVIKEGVLKGYISVSPAWKGLDKSAFEKICSDVYSMQELEETYSKHNIQSGEEHSSILSFHFSGYQVPLGVMFLTSRMPSLTISRNNLKFNKACKEKLNSCEYIELLYHPILQRIAIRECEENDDNAIPWNPSRVKPISARGICSVLYETMGWQDDYKYKFRGITKTRNDSKIMFFSLDEPQICPGKASNEKNAGQPKRVEKVIINEETNEAAFGMSYQLLLERQSVLNAISEADILMSGIAVENPNIGTIPAIDEIERELEQLRLTM